MTQALQDLLAGLRLRAVEGVAVFDRPTAVRYLASATLRGVAGYCLAAVRRDAVERWFKPGQGGSRPSAGLFQPLHSRATTADEFSFRIITWDPEGGFLEALVEALSVSGPGRPFGGGGSHLERIEFGSLVELQHEGISESAPVWRIILRTPLGIEREGLLLGPDTLTLGHIVHAMVWRLNLVSEYYGNRARLDPVPWMAQASLVREHARRLEQVEPRRWSSTQNRGIPLTGIVGELLCSGLRADVASLLVTGAVFHIGKHTAEGCGQVLLEPG